jgi:hypothetical protein
MSSQLAKGATNAASLRNRTALAVAPTSSHRSAARRAQIASRTCSDRLSTRRSSTSCDLSRSLGPTGRFSIAANRALCRIFEQVPQTINCAQKGPFRQVRGCPQKGRPDYLWGRSVADVGRLLERCPQVVGSCQFLVPSNCPVMRPDARTLTLVGGSANRVPCLVTGNLRSDDVWSRTKHPPSAKLPAIRRLVGHSLESGVRLPRTGSLEVSLARSAAILPSFRSNLPVVITGLLLGTSRKMPEPARGVNTSSTRKSRSAKLSRSSPSNP